MVVLVTVCPLLIPEYKLFCQKALRPVGATCLGSSSYRTRGPAPLQVERRRPRASLDYVKPGALGAQKL